LIPLIKEKKNRDTIRQNLKDGTFKILSF
jgi:hypothetical protein